jgi:hypothetical protein
MTAFHTIMLSWHGLPEMPSGASVARRLKSRISLRFAAVDCGDASVNSDSRRTKRG